MDRRKFLSVLAFGATEFLIGNRKAAARYVLDTWEPPIRKLFLNFTEYEERISTETIVIHHAGFPDGDKDSSAEEIHKFHQEVNGWAGIGYHYVIRKDGTIEQGRKPLAIGAHALHFNKNSVGICVAGNFELAKPNPQQMDSLKLLSAWLCQKYKINPLKKGAIVGHRDLNDTSCPGKNLYSKLGDIRRYCHEFNS